MQFSLLDIQSIRQAIEFYGVLCKVELARDCECVNRGPDESHYVCPYCNGLQLRYYQSNTVKVLMINKYEKELFQKYNIPSGGCAFSIPVEFRDEISNEYVQEYIPGDFTKITCLKEIVHVSEVKTKGALNKLGITMEKTLNHNVITGSAKIFQGNTEFIEGTDFNIVDDILGNHRIIEWIPAGSMPVKNSHYTIVYKSHPVYIALPEFFKPRRQSDEMLLSHVICALLSKVDRFNV